ncbi:U6 snRNA-associated Sm-like protein LSm7 [Westerdykella ornata]|uniref:U6 snRNA-associated Sm-like protein LSm7 n=1 Tax=Westerdykella ornata TaxID=318751 RepID=A0A6A6JMR6_WESOR|nr:U6 snRNA-associated Sm-like protein LSm7 [Westerdykella ornata]KAF2277228.1 U6 snRNA-associated Sm-like protein LSm7 [Westerdykella ornata]
MSSERGAFRGTSGGRGRGGRGRGGGGGSHHQQQHHQRGGATGASETHAERPKKENILDLGKYMDKQITVKFSGGREVIGTLKGYDQLMNLVLDEVREAMTDEEGNVRYRKLGLIVARGTLLVVISPVDGSEEISNPFIQEEE